MQQMRRSGVLATMALATAMAVPAPPATGQQAPTWEGVTLARGAGLSRPDVVTDHRGRTTTVWSRSGHVFAVRRSASGGLGTTMRLGRGRTPQVGVDAAGTVTVVWVRTLPGHGPQLMTARRATTGGWGAARALTAPVSVAERFGRGAYEPQLAVGHGGAVAVTWMRGIDDSGANRVRARYRPAGQPWEPAVTLSDVEGRSPTAAVGGHGQAVVVFTVDARAFASRHVGGRWTTPRLIGRHVEPPRAAMDDAGDITVVWSALEADRQFRPEAVTRGVGGPWTAPVTLDPPTAETPFTTAEPVVACGPLGVCRAAWSREDGRVVVSSRPPDGDWSTPGEVAPAGARVVAAPPYVDLAIGRSGAALLTWTRAADGRRSVEAAYRAAHGGWDAPVRVTPSPERAAAAAASVGRRGRATLVWRAFDPQGAARVSLAARTR